MKSKTFVDPRWIAAIIFGIFLFFGGGFMMLYFGIGMVIHYNELGFIAITIGLFGVSMGVFSVILYIGFLLPKSFSLLSVSSKKIVWLCPFYRRVAMRIEDCKYVGVEDMAYHNRAMPVIRGDEIAYIYLSNKPFPEKYKHKADAIRRKKGIITFAYSDELCQELISILPQDKTYFLISFYNRMQAADRAIKIKTRKK